MIILFGAENVKQKDFLPRKLYGNLLTRCKKCANLSGKCVDGEVPLPKPEREYPAGVRVCGEKRMVAPERISRNY